MEFLEAIRCFIQFQQCVISWTFFLFFFFNHVWLNLCHSYFLINLPYLGRYLSNINSIVHSRFVKNTSHKTKCTDSVFISHFVQIFFFFILSPSWYCISYTSMSFNTACFESRNNYRVMVSLFLFPWCRWIIQYRAQTNLKVSF